MSLHRRLWQLAWPLILSNITVPLLGLVDTAVLGHLDSPNYLAAVAIGANLFTYLFWSFGFLRMGTTGLTAQAWGAGDPNRLREGLLQGLLLALVLGCTLLLLQTWLVPIGLKLMQTPAELWAEASLYSGIRILGAPAILMQYTLIGWLIGSQRTRLALVIAVTTNLVNIGLDLWLVVGLDMRTSGVAWATVCAEYSSVILAIWLITRGKWELWWRSAHQESLFQWRSYRQLLRFNIDLFFRTITLLFVFAFFTAQGAQLGPVILAANAVLLTFLLLTSNALDGFANGAEALCGEALGAGRLENFHRAVQVSGLWSLITASVLAFFFYLLGNQIIALLTDLTQIRAVAAEFLPWMAALPLVGVWSYWLDGIFIGATKARAMRNTVLLATFLVFLPLWWSSQSLANHGLWLSLSGFLLARGAIQWVLFRRYTRENRWF